MIIGKANCDEFAMGSSNENSAFGPVSNPVDPERVPGGSSGGSAAALAADLAELALGSDTAGSIRCPAACCGVVGFKPTFGLVPTEGCFPLAPSFDHVGPLAPDVAGCVAAMEALAPGLEPRTLGSLEEVAVAVAWIDECDPLVRARVAEAALRAFQARNGPREIGTQRLRFCHSSMRCCATSRNFSGTRLKSTTSIVKSVGASSIS